MHRGPLRDGEWVRLVDSKGRKHNICLEAGKRFFSNRGHFDHDELIGREEGFTVTSSAGGEYLVFRPLLSEFVVSMPRGAAVVYPKDAAQIVAMADIFPGADVVEAGVGSGALTCSLLRAVGPHGRVTSYERREEFAEVARRNVTSSSAPATASHPAWPLRLGDLAEELPASGSVRPDHPRHAGALGVPRRGRWRAAGRRHRLRVRRHHHPAVALHRDGAGARRVHRAAAWESLVRDWHVEGLAVRPGHKMIGHTAFLVTARRMAAGERAPREDAPAGARRVRAGLHRSAACRRTRPPARPLDERSRSCCSRSGPRDARPRRSTTPFCRFLGVAPPTCTGSSSAPEPLGRVLLDSWSGILLGGGAFTLSDPEDTKSAVQRQARVDLVRLLGPGRRRRLPVPRACYGIGSLGSHQGGDRRPLATRAGRAGVGRRSPRPGSPTRCSPDVPRDFAAYGGHKEALSPCPATWSSWPPRPRAPVQAFRVGEHVYATQFHPELDLAGVQTRIEVYATYGYFDPSEAGVPAGRGGPST